MLAVDIEVLSVVSSGNKDGYNWEVHKRPGPQKGAREAMWSNGVTIWSRRQEGEDADDPAGGWRESRKRWQAEVFKETDSDQWNHYKSKSVTQYPSNIVLPK